MKFCDLVAAAERAHTDAPPTTDGDALDGIQEHLDWIMTNIEEGDAKWAKLHNLAHAAAAVNRYAFLLMSKMKASEVRQAKEELCK